MERNSECHSAMVYSKWKETAKCHNVLVYSKWKETANVTMFWFTLNGKKKQMSQCFGLL